MFGCYRIFFLLFILFAIFPPASRADWVNLSGAENAPNIAEITVEKDHVRIQLEVFVEDLMIFEELIPEGFFSKPLPGRPESCSASENISPKLFFRSSPTRARNCRSPSIWWSRVCVSSGHPPLSA